MFGDYNDLDICGLNRGGGFDDPSDETNYSFDAQSDAGASISDDYIDTFDSENANEQVQPQVVQNNSHRVNVAPQQEQTPQYEAGKGSSSIYLLAVILLVVVLGGLLYFKKSGTLPSFPSNNQEMGDYFYDKATENAPELADAEQIPIEQPQQEENAQPVAVNTDTMATIDVDLAKPQAQETQTTGAVSQIQKPTEKKAKPEQKNHLASVVIPVSSGGRLDPFAPFNEAYKKTTTVSRVPKFDIVAPPLEIPEADPMIDKLMEVKITGIMYDNVRPSAIIVVDGNEQLVHKGDYVCDYKILDITRNKVVMKYKTNIYEVSAGQTLTTDGVNLTPVSPASLSRQFGGAYSKQQGNVIQFN